MTSAPPAEPSRLKPLLKLPLYVLALYVLALGPIAAMSRNGLLVENADKWAKMIYRPLVALDAPPLLRQPLDWYMDWWTEMLKRD